MFRSGGPKGGFGLGGGGGRASGLGAGLLVEGLITGATFALGLAALTSRSSEVLEEELVGDEQAIRADIYSDDVEKTVWNSDEKVKKYYEQKPKRYSIKDDRKWSFRDVWNDFIFKFHRDDRGENNDPRKPELTREEEECLTFQAYEIVEFPAPLNFDAIILANRASQGLLHTFARHHDQWVQFIPRLQGLINQLPESVRKELNTIQQVTREETKNKELMRRLYAKLNRAIEKAYYVKETRIILMKIQTKILRYIRRAVIGRHTSQEDVYIGDYVSGAGVRHLFRVQNMNGYRYVIALAMSDELDIDESLRPFRSIITAFFVKEHEILKSPNFKPPETFWGSFFKSFWNLFY